MKYLFTKLIDMLDGIGNITEALMYLGGEFSKIKVELPKGTYVIAISKETDTKSNDKDDF